MPDNRKDNPAFIEKIQKLHDKYRQALPEKYQEIQLSWENLKQNPGSDSAYEEFYRVVHTFKGTSSTFGFTTLADICLDIQHALNDLQETQQLDLALSHRIESALSRFRDRINDPADNLPL